MADSGQEGHVEYQAEPSRSQAEEYLPLDSAAHQGGEDGTTTHSDTAPSTSSTSCFPVKTRGLPYEATKNEIIQFLSGCKIRNERDGVHILVGMDGRPSGEAIVELESQQDVEVALKHSNEHMGRRYVEVIRISQEEMNWELGGVQPGGAPRQQASAPYGGSDGSALTPADPGDFVARLRGLPWSATAQDVLWLLKDCQVLNEEKGVHFTVSPDGRPSGEAFVELCTEEDVSKALGHNNEHMGKRYVEIFRASRGQMEWDCRMAEKVGGGGSGGVVRLRGLPFKCSEEQVRQFFSGLTIPVGGVIIQMDEIGKETGEGYVEFMSKDDAEKALAKNRQVIGHRYIEIFRSTHAEIKPVLHRGPPGMSRPTPYDRPGGRGNFGNYGGRGFGAKYGSGYERPYRGRGGGGPPGFTPPFDPYGGYYGGEEFYQGSFEERGFPPPDQNLVAYPPIRPSQPSGGGFGVSKAKHVIRMRGLPYSAKEKDITEFFAPVVPMRVNIDFDHYGRPSGEAEVQFASHEEAISGMQKNNGYMGHRYIELFLNSHDEAPPPAGIPPHGGAQMLGGPSPRGPPMAPGGQRFMPPPQQAPPTSWNDPRTQGRATVDMGHQALPPTQGGMYDTGGQTGYGQLPSGQQYGVQQGVQVQQQYGGYQQQAGIVQQQQQQQQQQQYGSFYGGDAGQPVYQQQGGYAHHEAYGQQQQAQQQWY